MLKLKVENIIIEENKIGGQGCRFYFTKNSAYVQEEFFASRVNDKRRKGLVDNGSGKSY